MLEIAPKIANNRSTVAAIHDIDLLENGIQIIVIHRNHLQCHHQTRLFMHTLVN